MHNRMKLDASLKELLGLTFHVYFQPPNNIELQYPACIYTFDGFNNRVADNALFMQFERYSLRLIVATQVEPIVLSLMKNPKFTYVTSYPTGAAQFTYIFRTTI
jgi:hypothetical protein